MKNQKKQIFTKFISIILLLSFIIMLSNSILFKPKKANAQLSVPTSEVPLPTSSTFNKEYILDTIVRSAAKGFVGIMVDSIANWARGGFRSDNQPFAIASWENYFKRAFDVGTARFIEEFNLTPLCSPIKITLQNLGLTTLHNYMPSYNYYAACTLEDIVGNIKDFYENPSISLYGWSTWTALAQPQHNIYGSFLLAAERRAELESEAKEAKEKEATVSGGYQNFSECMKRGEMGICIDEMIRTTGTEVHDMLENAIRADLEWLISADEISELIGAFITGFWRRILAGVYNIYDPFKDLNLLGQLPPGGEYPPIDLPPIEPPEEPEPPPTCDNCTGVFVRGRYAWYYGGLGFSCNGDVCGKCTGVGTASNPPTPCQSFCVNVKENDWPNPDQPQTFDETFLNNYSALFSHFGWGIPESCECSRAMLPERSDYSDYCRECVAMPVPAGETDWYFSACKTTDWCEANCESSGPEPPPEPPEPPPEPPPE